MLRVSCRFQLRYRDLDLLGHLNQSAYHDLLGEARALFFSAASGGLLDYVVRRVELDYLAEISEAHRSADVHIAASALGHRSLTLVHEIVRPDGVVAATGTTVMVAFDRVARSSRDMTPLERKLFSVSAHVAATG